MTEEQNKGDVSVTDDNKQQGVADTSKKNSDSRPIIPVLIVIVIALTLIIAGGGYYFWSQLQTVTADADQARSALAETTNANRSSISALNSEVDSLASRQESLNDALTKLMEQRPETNEDWALSEIEYLVVIAMHRVLLERDVDTALAALEAADRRLRDLRTPQVIPVREQIAADINKLRSVNKVDISGLAVYMADLVDRARSLPVHNDVVTASLAEDGNDKAPVDTGSGWRNLLSNVWTEIKSLVVIKHEGETQDALLLPDQEYFLYQNLRLELENARLAILRQDTTNFHASIELVAEWLRAYFDTSDPAVKNILDSLEQMLTLELQPELPDISSSLETVRAYIKQRDDPAGDS